MRMLIDVDLPLEPFNTLVRNGTAGRKIQQMLEEIKPQGVELSEQGGKHGGTMTVDGAGPSSGPSIAGSSF